MRVRIMSDEEGQFILLPPGMEVGENAELNIERIGDMLHIWPVATKVELRDGIPIKEEP